MYETSEGTTLFGWYTVAKASSLASGTLATPTLGSARPPYPATCAAPRVTALKTVLFPLPGSPTIATSIVVTPVPCAPASARS